MDVIKRGAGIPHAEGNGANARLYLFIEFKTFAERAARLARSVRIDHNVDIPLTVQLHLAGAVAGDGMEAHHFQNLTQSLGFGRDVFDELNAVQPNGVGRVAEHGCQRFAGIVTFG